MRATKWAAAVIGATLAACGGGGGGDHKITPPPPAATYSDVLGVGVSSGADSLTVGQWPAWASDTGLVAACATGQVFYADRCWDEMVVDVDAMSVTFAANGGGSAELALGAPIPAALKPLVLLAPPQDYGGGTVSKYGPHQPGVGYVDMRGPWMDAVEYTAADVWDTPIVPWRASSTQPLARSPWALGSQLQEKDGKLSGFLVRTTMFYGFRKTSTTGAGPDTYELVHNWAYRGLLRVAGHELPFPLHLREIAAALSGTATTTASGSLRLDLAGGQVRLQSERAVIEARKAYGGAGPGLSESDVVTSIEFHDIALLN